LYFRLAIALLIVIIVIWALRWFVKTPPKQVVRLLKRLAIGTGIGILIYLAATGRLHWLFALIGSLIAVAYRLASLLGLVPLLQRLFTLKQTIGSTRSPSAGQTSDVETRYLRMSLDHDSGVMNGEVLEGRFKGQQLSDMNVNDLFELLNECRAQDPQSATILETYLDRTHGDQWRHESGNGRSPESSVMTPEEAYEVLGLSAGASEKEVVEAHRRLMQKFHPDRGGSTYLAAKLNQAKDTLFRN
jgi:hypothetical protein